MKGNLMNKSEKSVGFMVITNVKYSYMFSQIIWNSIIFSHLGYTCETNF